jgi:hypothetical protein
MLNAKALGKSFSIFEEEDDVDSSEHDWSKIGLYPKP